MLEQEIAAFEAMLPKLRKEHGEAWAVVAGSDLQGAFSAFEDAASFAVQRCADRPFLIRHTHQHPAQIPFVAIEA